MNTERFEKALAEIKAIADADKPRYMIYYSVREGKYVPVCVQDFDLPDYHQERFYDDTEYKTEREAFHKCVRLNMGID